MDGNRKDVNRHHRGWAGGRHLLLLLLLALPLSANARPAPRPYAFLEEQPNRNALGLVFGSPGWMVARYEWTLLRGDAGRLPRAVLGVDALMLLPGAGVAYRQRAGETPLFFTFSYQYISVPPAFRKGDVDLGPAVRHNAEFGFELRSWNGERGKSWVFGAGGLLEISPEWETTVRVMGTFGVLHRL